MTVKREAILFARRGTSLIGDTTKMRQSRTEYFSLWQTLSGVLLISQLRIHICKLQLLRANVAHWDEQPRCEPASGQFHAPLATRTHNTAAIATIDWLRHGLPTAEAQSTAHVPRWLPHQATAVWARPPFRRDHVLLPTSEAAGGPEVTIENVGQKESFRVETELADDLALILRVAAIRDRLAVLRAREAHNPPALSAMLACDLTYWLVAHGTLLAGWVVWRLPNSPTVAL